MIVMTVSGDRPAYLARTLASWAAARGVERWSFGFAVEPGTRLDDCLDVLAAFPVPSLVRVNDRRLGVLANPHTALTWAIVERGAAFAVLAEEDVVVGDDVLEFFTSQCAAFRSAPDVLGLCAFSRLPAPQPADAVATGHFSPWVWGTWADRWHGDLSSSWFSAARASRSRAGRRAPRADPIGSRCPSR